MNILKLNLGYDVKTELEKEVVNDQGEKEIVKYEASEEETELAKANYSRFLIETASITHFKAGLNRAERRVYSSLHKKIDKAIEDQTFEIKLQSDEIKLLKEVFEDARFPLGTTDASIILEDAIALL